MQSIFNIALIIFSFVIGLPHAFADNAKNVWFLSGHMQDLFEPEYLESMLNAGYDLKPMHELKKIASEEGYNLLMADPNSIVLAPFSHEKSGIPKVANHKPKLPEEALNKALKDFEYIIVFEIMPHQLNYLKHYPKEKLILFLWEPPSVMPQNFDPKNHEIFSKVYTWNDELVDNKKYYKFLYPVLHPMIDNPIPFETKRLCTMIAGNRTSPYPGELYSARRNMIAFFEREHPQDFDLYGKWWPASYKTYQGPVDNKINCLKYYRFCIAYENVKNISGYITEKIFDCFQAGCVPVYWGASNIADYIPKNCFIDRNEFKDEAALYAFMEKMTEEQYGQYIKNIQSFLASSQAELFSGSHFVNIIMNLLKNVKAHDQP